jgi:hypothetical protein
VEYNPNRFTLRKGSQWERGYQTVDKRPIADRPTPFGGEADVAARVRNPNSQKRNDEDYGANHGGGSSWEDSVG